MEVGVWVAFLVLVFAGFAYWCRRSWYLDWGAFKAAFGFEPPLPKQGLAVIEKAQQRVDDKLHILAEDYAEADIHERKAAKPVLAAISSNAVKRAQGPLKAEAYKSRLARTQQDLGKAKAKFWRAHGLAKAFSFHVHEKYTSYLTIEMRRKVLGLPQPQRGGHGSA